MMLMGLRIRRARLQAGMTQGMLAGKVGVHRSAVTQWEREGGTRPSIAHLAQISVATGMSFEWIATGRGEVTRISEIDAPIVAMDHAVDETEARLLQALRRLPQRKRGVFCSLLETLVS